MKTTLKLGDWNAECDICGFKYKASQLRESGDLGKKGLKVCKKCYDPLHPQDLLRGREDNSSVPWSRPPDDESGGTDLAGNTVTSSGVIAHGDESVTIVEGVRSSIHEFPTALTAKRSMTLPESPVTNTSYVINRLTRSASSAYDLVINYPDPAANDSFLTTLERDTVNASGGWTLSNVTSLVYSTYTELEDASGSSGYATIGDTEAGTVSQITFSVEIEKDTDTTRFPALLIGDTAAAAMAAINTETGAYVNRTYGSNVSSYTVSVSSSFDDLYWRVAITVNWNTPTADWFIQLYPAWSTSLSTTGSAAATGTIKARAVDVAEGALPSDSTLTIQTMADDSTATVYYDSNWKVLTYTLYGI